MFFYPCEQPVSSQSLGWTDLSLCGWGTRTVCVGGGGAQGQFVDIKERMEAEEPKQENVTTLNKK